MKVKTRQETIIKDVEVYIADDGKEFCTEYECKEYEATCRKKKFIKNAEKLRIRELDDVIPPTPNSDPDNIFIWYKVNSKEDYDNILAAYDKRDYASPAHYPEIVCIESSSYEEYDLLTDIYPDFLSSIKKEHQSFWNSFGYNMILGKQPACITDTAEDR